MLSGEAAPIGIDDLHLYAGCAYVDLSQLAAWRGLDPERFEKLLMHRKTVALPFEDPISFAVNAAYPLVNRLSEEEKQQIELLIVATESGIDFGKAMSSYVQSYLGLSRNCRTFEVKHACYGGTAAFQMACAAVAASGPESKALVITTDVGRPIPRSYAEPAQGAAAVALLVSRQPRIFQIENGACGFYGHEVMDTCRPEPDIEVGDPDLSLLSYLECIEQSFRHYQARAGGVDFLEHFAYLAMHTPFGGMVKGAHRTMLRKLKGLPPAQVDEDFRRRVEWSLCYCREVGNIYSGAVFLALCGVAGTAPIHERARVGVFSYGSGCCSEFYSGFLDASARRAMDRISIGAHLAEREQLDLEAYEAALCLNREVGFGVKSKEIDPGDFSDLFRKHFAGRHRLSLRRVSGYHREYIWN
jgi:polyketide biosynthesis 3-hydroxy-3-methylglutaryl-CoA synthase-like enzyme PksG